MSLADLAIKRPVFITAIVVVLLAVGLLAMKKMSVDLFPNVTFPIVMVQTIYPGAGPEEVETLVSRVLEDEISTVAGIKNLSSTNYEGVSTVVVEFTLETDIKDAEQQIRAKVSSAKRNLPTDIEEPIIRRIDPADQPIVILALTADLPPAELFDLADKTLRPRIEQVSQVGLVQVIGGREREIHVELDRKKLKQYEISATGVAQRIAAAGQNVPAGKVDSAQSELTFRTVGQFPQVADVGNVIVSFLGNDVPVTVNQVATVNDTVEDEATRAFVNGERSIFALVYRQTGANTINVADAVKKRVDVINTEFQKKGIKAKVKAVRDGAQPIRANVYDVEESILIGIVLTILVVYFFLGSGRSTFITGLALPNSLIGAFFLMSLAGFTINLMTLLALSLAVGLLIDDAIVVRENIFRHAEMGKNAIQAASDGTKEVLLAVVATTGAIIAVFGPVGFLSGVVGQFFKEFALTICFAMVISLFDAVTMAPMLSAYFAGHHGHKEATSLIGKFWQATMGRVLKGFDRFQTKLENGYASILRWMTKGNLRPAIVIAAAMGIFVISLMTLGKIPKTFLPPADNGEFAVSLEAPPGTNVEAMAQIATKIDKVISGNKEVEQSVMFVGSGQTGEANKASFFIKMIPFDQRKTLSTTMMKDRIRGQLKEFSQYIPIVKDIDNVGGGGARAFTMNIMGSDLKQLEVFSQKVYAKLKSHPAFLDVDVGYRPGKPEFQVQPDKRRSELLGVATNTMGAELRTQVEGTVAAVFREKGEEYDIRVRMKPDQRNLAEAFNESFVPNVNGTLVRLRDVAKPVETTGPATITRQNRSRYISIGADIDPKGPGMSAAMADIDKMFAESGELKLPDGVTYRYVGQAESFQELIESIVIAMGMGVLFIYLVLASLYESFITPFTILLVLPLAACGAFFALYFTGESLNIYSMIGCVLLLGVATKNSILLVDYTNQLLHEGKSMGEAVVEAGRVRLRPILMTTLALIAGMLPIAIGLNEASKQRTSMGVAVIGGLLSSTLLTLLVVPAAFEYMERFRAWSLALVLRIVGQPDAGDQAPTTPAPAVAAQPKDLSAH